MASYVWEILTSRWHLPKDTRPSFANRTVLITGANSGLGYEAALKVVQLGAAKVILAARTLSKGEEAQRRIEAQTQRTGVCEVWHLDMMDYASIQAFARQAEKELSRLDVAILNAGVVNAVYRPSPYGFEQTMQVNVLSTALLALLLTPKLRASKTVTHTPVLEIVGSGNHLIVSQLNSETEPFTSYNSPVGFNSPQNQYSVSKLFVMYIQTALVRLAANQESGKQDFFVPVVCPGATKSELARDVKEMQWYVRAAMALFQRFVQRETEAGARTYVSGVAAGEKTDGRFWKDDRVGE